MKLIYLSACAFGFIQHIAQMDVLFLRRERRQLVAKRKSCGSETISLRSSEVPKAFPKEDLHLIVYYNLVITLLLAIAVFYLALLALSLIHI